MAYRDPVTKIAKAGEVVELPRQSRDHARPETPEPFDPRATPGEPHWWQVGLFTLAVILLIVAVRGLFP